MQSALVSGMANFLTPHRPLAIKTILAALLKCTFLRSIRAKFMHKVVCVCMCVCAMMHPIECLLENIASLK